MLNLLDLRTVTLMATSLCGLMGLVLELLSRSTPEPVPGLKHWARATMLMFLSTLFFGLREVWPAFLTITLANGLVLLSLLVYLQGSHLYFERPTPGPLRDKRWWGFLGLILVGVAWFTDVSPSFRGRMVFMLGTMCFMLGVHVHLFWRSGCKSLGCRFTAVALIVMTLVFGWRWGHAVLLDQSDRGLFSPNGVQTIYTASYTFVLLMVTVGYALLATERMREAFEHQATHDSLTNVLNRRALLERLAQEVARCKRYKMPCAVLMLDLDHFKRVNDRYGHQMGDEVLKAFVRRVGQALRPNDLLGRLGGEEFLIVLPHTDGPAAQATAQRILRAVAQPDGDLPVCTVSIGLAAWSPQDESALDLMARTDKAMYEAKANGRNRVQVA